MRASQWIRSAPHGPGSEQVEEDLGAGLAGSDHGDVPGGEERLAVREVVGRVEDGDAGCVGERLERLGDVRLGSDAEDDVAGVRAAQGLGLALRVELGEVDFEQAPFGVPADRVDLVAEVQAGEPLADPAAVGVVLGALDVELLGEVEREEALTALQVVEEGPRAGRVGQGHQVGEERDLERGSLDEEARVPVEGRLLLVEGGGDAAGDPVREGGEREVEGADADAHEIEGAVEVVLGGAAGHRCALPSTRVMS